MRCPVSGGLGGRASAWNAGPAAVIHGRLARAAGWKLRYALLPGARGQVGQDFTDPVESA